ncbi:MAG: radical SAM protein, partial [Candidatus Diapherotrites archaeon]|nr:radical SAM protein [Candidatus Diapherotrites archaeon]
FNDDTLNVNKKHVLELCELIVKEKIGLPWAAYSRVDSVDAEIAQAMRKAGCFLVKVGFESGCDELLLSMKKGPRATTEQARKAVKCFKDAGIQVHGTFVFGMPGETAKTIRKTIDFAKQLDIDFVQFSIAQPYPGTEFFDYLKKNRLLHFKEWSDYLDEEGRITPIFEYPHLKMREMQFWIKQAYKEYYLRPSYIFKAMRQRLTNWELFKTSLRSAMSLLEYLR